MPLLFGSENGGTKMIVNKEKLKLSWTELLLFALSLIFVIGIRSWFDVCPVMSEKMMSCHWAGEMLKVITVLILVLAALHMTVPGEGTKIGMDISMIGICLMTAFVPGRIISICQNADMACRRVTQPWTIILCVALALLSLLDLIWYSSRLSHEKHRRKDSRS